MYHIRGQKYTILLAAHTSVAKNHREETKKKLFEKSPNY